ncbi:hypothetical protein OF83DRAFT_1019779, partial [Amylostereum chailletii]
MIAFTAILLALGLFSSAQAAPLAHSKRIAQNTVDAKTKWEAACDTAGGGDQCNTIAVNAIGTLLAAADACAQQNSADQMIDLAKQLNNDPDMIKLAQIFAQQPRNTPTSQSVPYCQSAPKNAELNGLFQCQFQGADATTFVGGVQVGGAGTIPFGMSAALSPAGSCPAHPDGPIADGSQLVDQVDSPGQVSSSGSGSSNSTFPSDSSATATASAPASTATDASDTSGSTDSTDSSDSSSTASSSSSSFQLQNGQDAQALNKKFAALTADSTCQEGDQACVDGGFAQCVGGKFAVTQCAGGTTCAALPLVNKAGTSIACTTEADATARIAATGAQGGLTG